MANDDFKTIGAGWKRTSKKGNNYVSMVFDGEALGNVRLEDLNIMLFPVKDKQNPKSPDYSISATLKEQRSAPPPRPQPRAPQARPQVKNHAPQSRQPAFSDDDPGPEFP